MNTYFNFRNDSTAGLFFEEPRQYAAAIDNAPDKSRALRFTLTSTDDNVSGSKRCEAVLKDVNGKPYAPEPFGKARRYTLGFFIPAPWRQDSKSKETIWQFHGTEDAGEARRGPVLQMYTFKDVWRIEQRSSATILQGSNDAAPVRLWGGLIQPGKWHTVVVEALWAWNKAGTLHCTFDGDVIIDQTATSNCYNDKVGPYLKIGLYKPSWAANPPLIATGVTSRTIFYSALGAQDM